MSKKRPKRDPIRFGGGGPYAPEIFVVEEARDVFFGAVRKVCPEAFRDLRDNVLPVYREWFDGLDAATRASAVPRNMQLVTQSAPGVAGAVKAWLARWHLEGVVEAREPEAEEQSPPGPHNGKEPGAKSWTGYGDQWEQVAQARALWPANWVLGTLAAWKDSSGAARLFATDPPGIPRTVFFSGTTAPPVKVQFEIPPWSGMEEIERFRMRVHAGADEWTDSYLGSRRAALERFMTKAPGKHGQDHFEWLALYQVCGRTEDEISSLVQVSGRSTVSRGIHSAAKLIGLVVRRSAATDRPRRTRRRFR